MKFIVNQSYTHQSAFGESPLSSTIVRRTKSTVWLVDPILGLISARVSIKNGREICTPWHKKGYKWATFLEAQ